uniref:RING-type E3 ubiquitin transferase n=1 Tax=Trichuris muris TaxID=70415 RepID=A0A5S6QUH1_TRIMR
MLSCCTDHCMQPVPVVTTALLQEPNWLEQLPCKTYRSGCNPLPPCGPAFVAHSSSASFHMRGEEMEEELRCPVCKVFFINPVLLPCSHSLCLSCALGLQTQKAYNSAQILLNLPAGVISSPDNGSISSSDTGSVFTGSDPDGAESDQLSLVSETDSGVLCNTSRPGSFVGASSYLHSPSGALQCNGHLLTCPACQKTFFLGDHGAQALPRNRALANVILRFCSRHGANRRSASPSPRVHTSGKCQLCDSDQPAIATVRCEQCDVSYCEDCLRNCHPTRGPLAKHQLQPVTTVAHTASSPRTDCCKCPEHSTNTPTLYCMTCRTAACSLCIQQYGGHSSHDVQSLASICKNQKTELSQTLHSLSEKAKTATEDIASLKQVNDKFQSNSADVGAFIVGQCDRMIAALQQRKEALLNMAMREKEHKNRLLRDQISSCTNLLQKTNGLIQFCIEALKEVDPVAFLQVSSALTSRVSNMELSWQKQLSSDAAKVSPDFDLTLDVSAVMKAIEQLNFVQMKLPGCPVIITEKCSAENNSAMIAWRAPEGSFVEGYVLEIDDGKGNGNYREVYVGPDTICSVENLHFGCIYHARVKAYNSTGDGDYSPCIRLQTAEAAWFQFNSDSCHPDIVIEQNNSSLASSSLDYRVVLGTVGLSRGRHYWEVHVSSHDANADVVIGVATEDVSRNIMLGKDSHGWSMYIDDRRSWYLHSETHHSRVEKGIGPGSVIGVLLDCDAHTLSFSVNGRKQTSELAFGNLPRCVLYPAFSVNRNARLTLHSGIDIPQLDSTDSSSSDEREEIHKKQPTIKL